MNRVAYLVSRYPAVSHAFIQREVLALRERGMEIDTFSLRRADDADVLSPADHAERDATYSFQPVRPGRLLRDHLGAIVRRPAAYLSGLAFAWRRGRGLRGRVWQLFYFAEAVQLWAELRRRGITHVHVHFANAGADVALLASRLSGGALTWTLTLHGPAEFFDVTDNRLASKLSSAAWVACVSDWVRSQAMSILPASDWDRLRVVRLGLDTSEWTPVTRDGARSPLRILNVGRLAPVKGQSVLIGAVALLRTQGIDTRCTIAGAGPERAALERQISELGLDDVVDLAGAVGQDRIRELYAAADVFCLPSFRESLPVVLMEALATELPVVATRIMGVPELVEDGVSGLLVTPGRVDQLAAALAELANDHGLRTSLGRAGRQAVQRDYELARLADDMRSALAAPATAAVSANR